MSQVLSQYENMGAFTQSKAMRRAEGESLRSKMDQWIIAEDVIIIKCRLYVFSIILIAAIIILGGMAIPFLVQNRILGVDPFQITSFCWFLAGFITIIAKSRYVSEWPWHDFLRGRVVCNSISAVHDVTRIDSQMILWYLLQEENDNILVTKGPYNGMFGRYSGLSGTKAEEAEAIKSAYMSLFGRKGAAQGSFAIDEPVHLSTMLASGFVLLKVLNEKGEHLICMDVRKGTEGEAYTRLEKEEFLACMNIDKALPEYGSNNSSPARASAVSEKVLKLTVHEFRWNKMLGLYVRDSKFG